MTITDERRRVALETLRICCELACDSSAITLILFVARPLATDFADLDAWASRQAAESPSGHDFGSWMPKGIEWRTSRIQTLAGTLVNLANLLRRLEAAGLREACSVANLYADERQGGIVQIGDASGRASVEAVAILAERWLRSAGAWDVGELPDDNEAAASILAEELLKPVWHDGREVPKGVRVAIEMMASTGDLDADAIKLVLEAECERIQRELELDAGLLSGRGQNAPLPANSPTPLDANDVALLEFLARRPRRRVLIQDIQPTAGPCDRKAVSKRLRKLSEMNPPLVEMPRPGHAGVVVLDAGLSAVRTP